MKNLAFLLLLSAALFAGCRWADAPKNGGGEKTPASAGPFNADYQPGIKAARLNVSGSACVFKLAGASDKLFHAELSDSSRHFSVSQTTEDSVQVIGFTMKKEEESQKHIDSLGVTLALNPNPVWDITLNTAASSSDFDLSALKTRSLEVKCAVGVFKAKLQPVMPDTYLDITSNVASVEISIPNGAACEVVTDSSFGGTDLDGFDKKDDSHYQTPGFATAKNKIHVKAKVSLGSFGIKRF